VRDVIPFSILDLAPIREGDSVGDALRGTLALAQHAEQWGYNRFWLAEHHNMPGIASSSTAVLIGHVAAHTERIRVGAGGVMLPNHSPLVVAEAFGTLAALYGDRIDLGLGRAPGTDQRTARALRHDVRSAHRFEEEIAELRAYFRAATPGQAVRAVPGAGLRVPLWVLGSTPNSAVIAAEMGLPYAFASHFAPGQLLDALAVYRSRFRPSEDLDRPYAMVGVNAVIADTDAEAQHLFTSMQMQFRDVRRGTPGQMRPPVEDPGQQMSPQEAAGVDEMLAVAVVGSPGTAHDHIRRIREITGADELLFTGQVFDRGAALRSYELLAQVGEALAPVAA
jgi:luciferase family oxidoreductase group 1